jgi:glycosyltransferase involved in cell wall biosynthesis
MIKVEVVHIITRFLKGGAEKNVISTIEALDKERFTSQILVGEDSDIKLISRGIKVTKIDSLVRSANPIKNLKSVYDIYKFLVNGEYHIVHTHLANAGMAGRIAGRLAGVPIIIHGLHGSTFHPNQNFFIRRFYILLERIASKFTTCFTIVGYDLRDKYLNEKIGKKEDYYIIRSGFSVENFYNTNKLNGREIEKVRKEIGANKGDSLVGVFASLEPRKGHIFMIEVGKRRKKRNVKFLFVGDGWYKEKLQEKVFDLGLEDIIIFPGYREDITKLMATCDVVALSSLWEGLPQVFVQGAASGKPIVSFSIEGATEVVKEGVNGYIVPLGDVKGFEKRLRYLLENPEVAKEMGKKGRLIIGSEWELTKMQEKVRELYDYLYGKYLKES